MRIKVYDPENNPLLLIRTGTKTKAVPGMRLELVPVLSGLQCY